MGHAHLPHGGGLVDCEVGPIAVRGADDFCWTVA
jgi:hypothetical protein